MPALDEAVRAGKIRAIGASNWTAARIREANRFARENGMAEFTVSEIRWSLAHVTPAYNEFPSLPLMDEHEYAAYQELGIPVLAWNSQASGVITKVLNLSLIHIYTPAGASSMTTLWTSCPLTLMRM